MYLAEKFMEFHQNCSKLFTVTKGSTILSNDGILLTDTLISKCDAEEADQKLVRHMIQCVKNDDRIVTIRTVDTDVLVLAISNRHYAENFGSKVQVSFVTDKSIKCYNINSIAAGLGQDVCQGSPFFYAFSDCDSVSSFFNQGKCKMWDRWQEFDDKLTLTKCFRELSTTPDSINSEQIQVLEKYILFVYIYIHSIYTICIL